MNNLADWEIDEYIWHMPCVINRDDSAGNPAGWVRPYRYTAECWTCKEPTPDEIIFAASLAGGYIKTTLVSRN